MSLKKDCDSNNYIDYNEFKILDKRSMIVDFAKLESSNVDPDYDPDADLELEELLAEELQELGDGATPQTNANYIKPDDTSQVSIIQCENYVGFSGSFYDGPKWYRKKLEAKIRETKSRLDALSKVLCWDHDTRHQVVRMEQDHNTPLCKFDPPKHPPLKKPWTNYWRFDCEASCKEDPPGPNHVHTLECQTLVMRHHNTKITYSSKSIRASEFPPHVIEAVELFVQFVESTATKYFGPEEMPDTRYEKPSWSYIKLRSNSKNELMMIVGGKEVTSLLTQLKEFFKGGPGKDSQVVSLHCSNAKRSLKTAQVSPLLLYGYDELKDKIGSLSLIYSPKSNDQYNSIETYHLGEALMEYLQPSSSTTTLDIGCNVGVLSLLLAQASNKVIGLNMYDHELKQAEEIQTRNKVDNVHFLNCTPRDFEIKCAPLILTCATVAVLDLASPYGKSSDVFLALRNLQSIWRVVIHGSFSRDSHKRISSLSNSDEGFGEKFLPIRSCIMDKSPSDESAFDILVLFERKCLINPSVPLLGPAVNIGPIPQIGFNQFPVKYQKGFIDPKSIKHKKGFGDVEVKPKKGFGEFGTVKNPAHVSFSKILKLKKFGRFDSPSLPKEEPNDSTSQIEKKPISNATNCLLPIIDNDDDGEYVPLPVKLKKLPGLAIKTDPEIKSEYAVKDNFGKKSAYIPKPKKPIEPVYSPMPDHFKYKELKKIFDCPSLPKEKFEDSSSKKSYRKSDYSNSLPELTSDNQSHVHKMKDVIVNSSPIVKENIIQNNSLPLSIKNELVNLSPPKEEKLPVISKKVNKKTKSLITIKTKEQINSCILKEEKLYAENKANKKIESSISDKEEGELSSNENSESEDWNSSKIRIKSEPIEPTEVKQHTSNTISHISNLSPVSNVIIKTEPSDVSIKVEPMECSPVSNSEDIENMKTPIHIPAALSNGAALIPAPEMEYIKTGDGLELKVKSNQSFLDSSNVKQKSKLPRQSIKQEPVVEEQTSIAGIRMKIEPKDNSEETKKVINSSEDEIEIITVKKSLAEEKKEKELREHLERRRDIDDVKKKELSRKISELERTMFSSPPRKNKELTPVDVRLWDNKGRRSPSPADRRYRGRSPPSPGYLGQRPKSRQLSPPGYKDSCLPSYRFKRSPISPARDRSRSPPYRYRRSPISPAYHRSHSPSYNYRQLPSRYYHSRSPPSRLRPSSALLTYSRSRSPTYINKGYAASTSSGYSRAVSPSYRFRRSPPPQAYRRYSPPSKYRRSRSPKSRRSPGGSKTSKSKSYLERCSSSSLSPSPPRK